ncbi:GIY-YIG nuclease family protein [Geobacillus phage GR1]|nr:GIY-YIG nuclease family protein [Geobacillus phage GR1]
MRKVKLLLASGVEIEVFEEIKREPGIYLIYNENTKYIYVGQSTDCYRRMNHHFNHLRIGIKKRAD